ncbi:MAG: vanadium-dependent haloperoxidase [Ferruginibacter sp.]
MLKSFLYCTGLLLLSWGCKNSSNTTPIVAENLLHNNNEFLNAVIFRDVFSPPVASRIYMYTSLAAYETLRYQDSTSKSLTAQLNGFEPMPVPQPNKKCNYLLAATHAYFTVAQKITFSKDSIVQYVEKIDQQFKNSLSEDEFAYSVSFGNSVGEIILKRAATDHYKETRGKPKYLGTKALGKWQPTPTDYLDGMEPYWNEITPLVMDSASQILPEAAPIFSIEKNSAFYKLAAELIQIKTTLSSEQKDIVKYWDDNPFVIEHKGHLTYANKKITPGGHWMGIAGVAAQKAKSTAVQTAYAYALTGVAMFDAFISCWDEKYRSQLIRPVTYINLYIEPTWTPTLQTPPFPEHTSGHSTVSAAAATVLTQLYGKDFAFHDNSDSIYIGMTRDFTSFYQASDEASESRVLGGIHYRTGTNAGAAQGRKVGNLLLKKVGLTKE